MISQKCSKYDGMLVLIDDSRWVNSEFCDRDHRWTAVCPAEVGPHNYSAVCSLRSGERLNRDLLEGLPTGQNSTLAPTRGIQPMIELYLIK